ncbi:MAG TPA: PEP-CTERM-box response regulator transcription factor [Verrucomicrobiae bacterium]|nr:PEP-CTERM-box response regulator transcription factor [Verrucomicrobiae bacterium]
MTSIDPPKIASPKLLLVDDDPGIRNQMRWALVQDYTILQAEDRPTALALFEQHRPVVVVLDLGLPPDPNNPEEGLAAIPEMLSLNNSTKIIVVTGQGEREPGLKAIGAGAYDFLTKPVDVEELKVILKRAYHVAMLERGYREMQAQLQGETFEGLLGTSTQMQQVFGSIRKVATTEAPVLLLGESGTGKEMVAQAIHRRSPRKEGPFVAINCGAIPDTLLESELFGHEKGSFTGAHVQRKGRIEMANAGTLFLDEIGEIPLQLQVKLLRFLQEQRIERVGGRQEIQVDTRVIAATNLDLKKAVTEERFREDLYYRIAVVVLKLPPLRDRDGDITLLAKEFLHRSVGTAGKEGLTFTQDAIHALKAHSWPGNVRELENRIKRAVIMAEGRRITSADLELERLAKSSVKLNLREAREAVEREVITTALRKHGGKITPAAAELGISRPTFYELMEKLGISNDRVKADA